MPLKFLVPLLLTFLFAGSTLALSFYGQGLPLKVSALLMIACLAVVVWQALGKNRRNR